MGNSSPSVQHPVAGVLKALGQGDELHQIGPAALAVGHGPHDGQQIELVHDLPDQLGAAQVRRHGAQGLQPPQKVRGVGILVGSEAQGVEKVRFLVGGTDERQLVRREAEAGRAQRRDQRDVLVGVVQHGKQVHERGDLIGAEIVLPLHRRDRDAPIQQRQPEGAAHTVGVAQQDGNIAVARVARHAVHGHGGVGGDQLLDLPGHKGGLAGKPPGGRALVRGAGGRLHQQQLRLRALSGIVRRGKAQRGGIVIRHVSQRPGHAGAKHRVGGIDDLPAGAEVLPQQDAPGLALGGPVIVQVVPVFFVENLRVRQAEAVDGLLDVAHHEQVLPAPGQGAEDRVLHAADVLELVHHDLGIARRQAQGQLGGTILFIGQKRRGLVLQVREVHQRGALLVGGVLLVESHGQTQQRLHGVVGQGHGRQQRRRGHGKGGLQLFYAVLAFVPPGLDRLGQGRVGRVAQRAQSREAHALGAGAGLVPAEGGGARQVPQLLGGAGEVVAVCLPDLLIAAHGGDAALQLPRPVVRRPAQGGEQLAPPDRVGGVGCRRGELGDHALDPERRAGVGLHLAVQLQHQFFQCLVIPAGAHGVGQTEKAGMCPGIGVMGVHDLVQGRALHGRGALLLDDAKVRRQMGALAVFAQKRGAEAVDRADLGAADQRALAAQLAVGRVLGDGAAELLHDAAL